MKQHKRINIGCQQLDRVLIPLSQGSTYFSRVPLRYYSYGRLSTYKRFHYHQSTTNKYDKKTPKLIIDFRIIAVHDMK